jgi:hypothetical protein
MQRLRGESQTIGSSTAPAQPAANAAAAALSRHEVLWHLILPHALFNLNLE